MKTILPFVLILLVGLSAFVYARGVIYNPPETNSGLYDYIYTVDLQNGWNLIPYSDNFPGSMAEGYTGINQELYNQYMEYINIPGLQRKKEDAPLFAYVYDTSKREYVEIFPDWHTEINQDLVRHTGMWVYVRDSMRIKYASMNVPPLNQRKLVSGWNFVAITPEMKGLAYKDFKGSCNMLRLCEFQRNNWDCVDGNSWNPNNVMADTEADIGQVVIIKVSGDCTLESTSGGIPSLPSLPNGGSAQCIDSDGGLDYTEKGTVSKEGWNDIEDFCIDNIRLSESICNNDGNPASAQYTCPNSCSNGECY